MALLVNTTHSAPSLFSPHPPPTVTSRIRQCAQHIFQLLSSLFSFSSQKLHALYRRFVQTEPLFIIDQKRLEEMTLATFEKQLLEAKLHSQGDLKELQGYFLAYLQNTSHLEELLHKFPLLIPYRTTHEQLFCHFLKHLLVRHQFTSVCKELDAHTIAYYQDENRGRLSFFSSDMERLFQSVALPYVKGTIPIKTLERTPLAVLDQAGIAALYTWLQKRSCFLPRLEQKLQNAGLAFKIHPLSLNAYTLSAEKDIETDLISPLTHYIKEAPSLKENSLSYIELEKLDKFLSKKTDLLTDLHRSLSTAFAEEAFHILPLKDPTCVKIKTEHLDMQVFLEIVFHELAIPFEEHSFVLSLEQIPVFTESVAFFRCVLKGHGNLRAFSKKQHIDLYRENQVQKLSTYFASLSGFQTKKALEMLCMSMEKATSFKQMEQAKQKALQTFLVQSTACGSKVWMNPVETITHFTLVRGFGLFLSFNTVNAHFEGLECYKKWCQNESFVRSYAKFKERYQEESSDLTLHLWARVVYRLKYTDLGKLTSSQNLLFQEFLLQSDPKYGWQGCLDGFNGRIQLLENSLKGGDGRDPTLAYKMELATFCWTALAPKLSESERISRKPCFDAVLSEAIGLGVQNSYRNELEGRRAAQKAIAFIKPHLFSYDVFFGYHLLYREELHHIQHNKGVGFCDFLKTAFNLTEEQIARYQDVDAGNWDYLQVEQDLPELICTKLIKEEILVPKTPFHRTSFDKTLLQEAFIGKDLVEKWELAEEEETYRPFAIPYSSFQKSAPWALLVPKSFQDFAHKKASSTDSLKAQIEKAFARVSAWVTK